MFNLKKIKVNSFLYLFAFLVILTETILNIYGKSVCTTEGCRIVESFVKGGNLFLLFSGLFLFGTLFFISIYKFPKSFDSFVEYVHSGILIGALSVEGYLLGFQTFIIKEFCFFCITVFGLIFIGSLLRMFEKRYEMILSFSGFVSIFLMTYVVNPEISHIPSNKYTLVYSKDCIHCEEVIQFCKSNSISIQTVEAKNITGILKSLRIDYVPVLFCDEGDIRKIIIGPDNIKDYLLTTKAFSKDKKEGLCPIFDKSNCD
ncbi:MAG: hypothetical protein RMI30_00745 [Thermodesulfovibrio sp.]|nr:hypothetical protein [Thermodesulfovibrio sp.]MDW7997971.1 hypothetical protein [Thermodesulfovibrio sp.]